MDLPEAALLLPQGMFYTNLLHLATSCDLLWLWRVHLPPYLLLLTFRCDGSATFDFTGTGPEVYGNLNAPPAVAYSAIIYSLRCLVTRDIPLNQGCLAPIKV